MSNNNQTSGPRVLIDEMVYQKIMHWVNTSDVEVSGLGKIVVENGDIRVIDAFLLPQRNGPTSTDIEPEDVAKAMYLTREKEGELKFWWHSHVNMPVFWSGTDMATIKLLGKQGWFVSTVFNKRQEMRSCISMGDPFLAIVDEIPTSITKVIDQSLIDQWNEDYKVNVTDHVAKTKPVPSTSPLAALGTQSPLHRFGGGQFNYNPFNSDGIYGDTDWSSIVRSDVEPRVPAAQRSAHSVTGTEVKLLLQKRNELEDELESLEDELDVYEAMGLVTEEERGRAGEGVN